MKTVIVIITAIHGLIHIIGFLKAFHLAKIEQLQLSISKPIGIVWLVAAIGFYIYLYFYLHDSRISWMIGTAMVVVSQLLIIAVWSEAKAGTIANILLLAAVIVDIGKYRLYTEFEKYVQADFVSNSLPASEILTAGDIQHLPTVVQKYLYYTKSVEKPKVHNVMATFTGGMRSEPNDEFMNIRSIQYNFYRTPSRYFYMEAQKMGLPASGLHLYRNATATFRVNMLNWFPVVDAYGSKMNQAETVTLLNDMCFIAPATLIDSRITWKEIDSLTVQATLQLEDIRVQAILFFNEEGELINFRSNDRYHTDGKTYYPYPWETPVADYTEMNGYILPSKATLQYIRPDGIFVYGELTFSSVQYNLTYL